MNTSKFLTNNEIWKEMGKLITSPRRVDAAIAYLGTGGANLLRLRKDDRLITDMSMATVRSGGTNPFEVEKFIRRGVRVFSRRSLHAKVIISGNSVISGSANISHHSKDVLDEAAIWTNDPAVLRRAAMFIERLCTEPVRLEYLEQCKISYRPPRLSGNQRITGEGQHRVKPTKLWIVNLVLGSGIPECEIDRYEEGMDKAKKLIESMPKSKAIDFTWSRKPRMANELERGDWVIQVVKQEDGRILVFPPACFLLADHYIRDKSSGKERWIFHLAAPVRQQAMPWTTFRARLRLILRQPNLGRPRTMPIRSEQSADRLMKLWTAGGRVSHNRRAA